MPLPLEISVEDIHRSIEIRKRKNRIAASIGVTFGLLGALYKESSLFDFVRNFGGEQSNLFDPQFWSLHGEILLQSCALGFMPYMFFGLLLNPARMAFTKESIQYIREDIAANRRQWQKGSDLIDEKDKAYQEVLTKRGMALVKDPLMKHIVLANHELASGRADDALKRYIALLRIQKESNYRGNLPEKLLGACMDLVYDRLPIRKLIIPTIEHAFGSLSRNLPKSAEKYFARASNIEGPLQIEANCLYGYFLNMMKDLERKKQKKAKQQWQTTIELILANKRLQNNFRRLGTSFHEVLEIASEGLLQDTFIFKRNTAAQQLEREYKIEQFLYNLFQGSADVVDPLALLNHEAYTYLVLRRVQGKPLTVLQDIEVWNETIDFVAEFHNRLNTEEAESAFPFKERADYHRLLRAYARRVAKSAEEKEEVTRATEFIGEYLAEKPQQLLHGDLHPDNIFVPENSRTILDPEHMMYGRHETDLVDIVESRLVPKKFTEAEREGWRRRYYDGRKNESSYDYFRLQYAYAAVARLLKIIGALTERSYGFTPEQVAETKQEYAQRAQKQLQVIVQLDERKKEQVKLLEERLVA